ncbi:ATP-binding protein [Quisquiliibacterium transsilvanicum]|uniref:histidine kinase n=1 Tax=Quisquiliibacterium transsilvanicum TaxID=1549638 RepID=A0A7W8HFT5_9BURK|nr:ATP-binding protein [Quisquiliibacterium transsilvanicum]MBB5271231.1 two-component system sensor histidine kinase QseC [Quisquiliibacterium transsilvanicum]
MRSIRARILVLLLALLGLSLSLISFKTYRDAEHELQEVFDAELAQTARLLAGMVSRDMQAEARAVLQASLDEAVRLAEGEEAQRLGHKYEGKLVFFVFDSVGNRLLQSASAAAADLEQSVIDEVRPASAAGAAGKVDGLVGRIPAGYHDAVHKGVHWRLFMLHDQADDQRILVGERADVRGELAESIALQSLLPALIGLPLMAVSIWLAVGWGLRPLRQMVRMLKRRDPDNLSPLLLAPVPDELSPVVASLNRLLLQVTELLERERRFVAYAAHELRTPLAVLRLQAHNAAHAQDPLDRDEALGQLDSSVARATRVVEQLLTLARLEPGAATLEMRRQDLLTLVRRQLAELAPLALERRQDLALEADEGRDYDALVDEHCFGALLQNLVGNAVAHAPEGGSIRVSLRAADQAVELSVQDSGSGLPPDLRDRAFEPFFREGPGQGAGLGLSIAARVAELHGTRISLGDSPLGGLAAHVEFPRPRTPAG